MKNKKRIFSLLIIILLIVTLYSSVMAMSNSIISTPRSDIEAISIHVSKLLPMFKQISLNRDDIVSIGNVLTTYRINDDGTLVKGFYEEYPLIINGCISGIVNVIRVDGEIYQVSLGVNYANELQNLIIKNKNEEFAIIHTEDGVYIKLLSNSVNVLKIYNDKYSHSLDKLNTEVYTKINYTKINQENFISMNSVINPQAITRSKVLGVRYVPTAYPIDNPVKEFEDRGECTEHAGLCWASSIAMMANYHRGTNRNAFDIHNMFWCLDVDIYHEQEIDFINQLRMTAGGPYYSTDSSRFNYNNLYKLIDDYKLLLLDLEEKFGPTTTFRHNVVVNGYEVDENSARFHYIDPNSGAGVSTFPYSPYAIVYLPLGGYNYQVHCYITSK